MDVTGIDRVFGLIDAPVWLVTSGHGERRGGFIATTVTSASIVREMPRLLITVNKRHSTYPLIEASRAMALHLIDETQLDLVWRFGLQSGRNVEKFAGLTVQAGATGSPILPEALAWLDGRVEARMDSGDRAVYLIGIVDGRLERAAAPLTSNRLFAIAPPDKQRIMDEQYHADAALDAEAIRQWHEQIRRS